MMNLKDLSTERLYTLQDEFMTNRETEKQESEEINTMTNNIFNNTLTTASFKEFKAYWSAYKPLFKSVDENVLPGNVWNAFHNLDTLRVKEVTYTRKTAKGKWKETKTETHEWTINNFMNELTFCHARKARLQFGDSRYGRLPLIQSYLDSDKLTRHEYVYDWDQWDRLK